MMRIGGMWMRMQVGLDLKVEKMGGRDVASAGGEGSE